MLESTRAFPTRLFPQQVRWTICVITSRLPPGSQLAHRSAKREGRAYNQPVAFFTIEVFHA
jgi:hypothetical protein